MDVLFVIGNARSKKVRENKKTELIEISEYFMEMIHSGGNTRFMPIAQSNDVFSVIVMCSRRKINALLEFLLKHNVHKDYILTIRTLDRDEKIENFIKTWNEE